MRATLRNTQQSGWCEEPEWENVCVSVLKTPVECFVGIVGDDGECVANSGCSLGLFTPACGKFVVFSQDRAKRSPSPVTWWHSCPTPPRCSSSLVGALFPGQVVREGAKQTYAITAARLREGDDGMFHPVELEKVKQKDIVERFKIRFSPDGRLPQSVLDRLAEQAPPSSDSSDPPVPPVPDSEIPVDVDIVAEQAVEEAATAEFVQWSEMSKSQRERHVRERRKRRRELKETHITKVFDSHLEIACAVMKAEKARKLLQRENDAKGHIIATEKEVAQGLFKESNRKELARWCLYSMFDLFS
uniref:Uncharacterized protein n=1 Tax=Chromera velia CCMP2878 TaxID=1169474 RepID=A0A0G4GRX6_9ALVE|eukprot:Cvel_5114.t1-p1 / transcript=Cvel_5114.t1 / gene=Cvel_5114 / organism=Chromera_velia_CCMP2878 / gene_product=hypothetical protein / transcript_product=hypothetical protein / location=Cvel_scaffold234:16851-19331(-) / protein_length=301 / sequence_SO=supercontig / SO=protein_coding / is_pseudo=false